MSQDVRDEDRLKAERRAFLEKCGRFAVVTPPVVTLMLAVSDKAKAQLATSPVRTTTVTTRTTTTTNGTTTTTKTTTNGTVTTTVTPTTTSINFNLHGPSEPKGDLAMMIDSMGLKKVT